MATIENEFGSLAMLAAKPAPLMTILGDLRTFKQFEPGSLPHVDQLMNEQRDNRQLGDRSYYTPDGLVYFLKKGIPMLAITRRDHNPVLKHIDDAFEQFQSGSRGRSRILQNEVYRLSQDDIEEAINATDTEIFDLTECRLSSDGHLRVYGSIESVENFNEYNQLPYVLENLSLDFDGEFAERIKNHMRLSDVDYNRLRLNYEERRLAERIYGRGGDFVKNLKLSDTFKPETNRTTSSVTVILPHHRIYEKTTIALRSSNDVRINAAQGAFMDASLLYGLVDYSCFYSLRGSWVHKHRGLHGVPLKTFA
ncbi:TPA: hypothetical protein HA241_06160 [Candidatus Woesearchaeota archaeon]|nr:hypothetical protein [Candidatus Woesearchaeota archaeon]